MLELKQVTKIYETNASARVFALTDVNVKFRNSEFVCVLGPSGCGKTTMLNIIGGLDKYTEGDLIVDGTSTKDYSDRDCDTYRNRKIGFVFQSYNLIAHQTVLENVELALTLSGWNAQTRKRKAMQALEKVGLANHLRKKPNELSGGEMQRVAIARAIVNDPEIILADEPTGALDSKNSVQIMDLLKEISKERLVITVTHNDELANTYATRTIRLFDSKIVSDSNPFIGDQNKQNPVNKSINGTNDKKSQEKKASKETDENSKDGKTLNADKKAKSGKKIKKYSAMSFSLSLALSFKNLLTKKTRTTLTSLASSIGIIGLALVLALFNGLNIFLDKVQYDTLSAYPMSVTTSTTTDYEQVISIITDSSNYISNDTMKDKIFVSHLITQLTNTSVKNVITPEYLEYVKNAPKEYVRDVSYSYGTSMNVFKKKVVYNLDKAMGENSNNEIIVDYARIQVSSYFKELVGDKDFVLSQYDLVAGTYPESANELVLVLDKNNRISDMMLVAFLMDINASSTDENGEYKVNSYEYDEFICKKNADGTYTDSKYGTFTLALNDGLYTLSGGDIASGGYYKTNLGSCKEQIANKSYYGSSMAERLESECKKYGIDLPQVYTGKTDSKSVMDLHIVGILRLNENTTTGSMSAYPIGYTSDLTEYVVQAAKKSDVVQAQLKEIEKLSDGLDETKCRNVVTKDGYLADDKTALNALKKLGYAETPTKIEFYATSFEGKQALKKYLNAYNDTVSDEYRVYVTDLVSTVIDVLSTFINAITYILLSLTAISLFVAAIMIAIITYVSVIERTREIGILRSIGARKIDVMGVFNAETIIIGLFSGIIGVLLALLLQIPLNALLFSYTGISSLAVLSFGHAILLIVISVLVTLISGMIPAFLASKKDPVKALRSE